MSWEILHSGGAMSLVPRLSERLSGTRDQGQHYYRVEGEIAIVGLVAYAAVSRADALDSGRRPRAIEAVVVLLDPMDEDGYRIRILHERENPKPADCPPSILLKLSETDDLAALRWRDRCRARFPKVMAS